MHSALPIDDLIQHLTGEKYPEMEITVDFETEVIRISPPKSSGVATDFAYTVTCTGTRHLTFQLAMCRRDYELWRTRQVVVQQCFP